MIQFRLLILLTFASGALSLNSTTSVDRRAFTRIGAKFYWIEGIARVNWFEAAHSCRAIGGHLASIENSLEMSAISNELLRRGYKNRENYFWISGNDLGKEGAFYWLRTGQRFIYSKWSPHQPDNDRGNENCVHLWIQVDGTFFMNDWICKNQAHYIYQADDLLSFPVLGI